MNSFWMRVVGLIVTLVWSVMFFFAVAVNLSKECNYDAEINAEYPSVNISCHLEEREQ